MAYDSTDSGTGAGGGEPGVSDSLRTFGAVVQALREHAGLSREEFGALVRFSKHTVASVEQGRRMPDRDFVERGEAALGNTGALRKAAPTLTRQPGLASWFRQWARLEATAISLYTYECRVVPGLLQTEAYARAVSLDVPPLPDPEEWSSGSPRGWPVRNCSRSRGNRRLRSASSWSRRCWSGGRVERT